MAITRGQMQRQLREKGGVMSVAPREKFGFGSSFKRAVRKIIPNEVAKVATVAAPFVAPFNPQLAGAMAGIGSFDQTGSISNALKSGALTYGAGQIARGIGGAEFQDPSMSLQGFTNLSSPTTGATIFGGFGGPSGGSIKGLTGIGSEGLTGSDVGGNISLAESAGGTSASPNILAEQMSEASLTPRTITETIKKSAPKSVTQAIKNQDYFEAAKLAAEKGTKALFLDKDGDLDKTVLFAAGTAGLSYLDAKKLADEIGEDIGTEEEYDEATKDEFKKTYAGYLTNFFEGKKDGGRIGFDEGANEKFAMIKDMLAKGMDADTIMSIAGATQEEIDSVKKERVEEAQGGRIGFMFGDKVEDKEGILSMMSTGAARAAEKQDMEQDAENQLAYFPGDVFSKAEIARLFSDRSLTSNQDRKDLYKILMNPGMYPEAEDALIKLLRGKQDGGRIGFESGTMPMADSSFKFTELIEDDTDEKEKLINELMEKGYRFEDIMQLVSPKTERLMDDGTYKQYGDAPSISLGKIGFNMGGEVPVKKNKAGIEELDYRQTGGFVPVGVKEKADDVPAMLSKNEFVLTADAVRGIGGGDVEKGAEKLYGVMKQAEKVGKA